MSAPEVPPACRYFPPPELSLYREQCLALLHRYFVMSVEAGRLPALLGREIFRTRARSYRLVSFEDMVIFVHDVERCLRSLAGFDQELIARIVFQEYTQEEAAALMGCGLRTIERRFPEAIDVLTEIFLANGMLKPAIRQHRHLMLDKEPVGGIVDLNACAADVAEYPRLRPSVVVRHPAGKTCQAPFSDVLLVTRWNARKNNFGKCGGFSF